MSDLALSADENGIAVGTRDALDAAWTALSDGSGPADAGLTIGATDEGGTTLLSMGHAR